LSNSTACFQNIGVKAVSTTLQTSAGTKIVVPLAEGAENKDPEQSETTERNKLMKTAQVTLKHKISDKSYHELTQLYPALIRSHKVTYHSDCTS